MWTHWHDSVESLHFFNRLHCCFPEIRHYVCATNVGDVCYMFPAQVRFLIYGQLCRIIAFMNQKSSQVNDVAHFFIEWTPESIITALLSRRFVYINFSSICKDKGFTHVLKFREKFKCFSRLLFLGSIVPAKHYSARV